MSVTIVENNLKKKLRKVILWSASNFSFNLNNYCMFYHSHKPFFQALLLTFCVLVQARKIFFSLLTHCPKKNLNLRLKPEPVTATDDATVNVWFMFQIYVWVQKPPIPLQPWQTWFFYAEFRLFFMGQCILLFGFYLYYVHCTICTVLIFIDFYEFVNSMASIEFTLLHRKFSFAKEWHLLFSELILPLKDLKCSKTNFLNFLKTAHILV